MSIVKRIIITAVAGASLAAPFAAAAAAHAEASTSPAGPVNADNATNRLANIKSKGDSEISRRLTTLNTLSSKISSYTKTSASDKQALTAEVTAEINGLTALKTKLDAETTVAAAASDVSSMVTEYRVYALLVPKVALIKTADDQQAVEAKLQAMASKLQTRITAAKTAGTDVTAMQASLDDLNAKVTAAVAISSSVEQKVLALQPNDYNSDHTVLGGYRDQLKTAHSDNLAAYADAKSIVTALKNLKQ